MKKLLALTLAMVMAFALFAGCAKTPAPGSDGPSKPVVTPDGGKKIRTDIVLGEGADVVSLDPHSAVDTTSMRGIQLMYNTLIKLNTEGELVPSLATSWEQKDETTYVFNLAQGVKFHSGDEMKASDVKFSLDREMNAPKVKIYMEGVKEVTVVDDYTIQIVLTQAHAPFLMNMASTASSILSQKAVEIAEAKGAKYGENPIGTGPMKYDSWKVNDSLSVVRFDDYFAGAGKTTSIKLRVIPESSSRTIALETGEVDFLSLVPAIDVRRVKENKELKFVDAPNAGLSYVGFNQAIKPYDNKLVRQALAYAIDKEAMVQVILEGNGQVATSIFTSVSPVYHTELKNYPYDLAKAKALLVEAGYPDGFSAELVTSGDERNRVAQLIQSSYGEIGVKLDIQLLEWGAYLEYISGKTHQIFINGTASTMNPDSTMTSHFHSASVGPTGNRWWYINPAVDTLIETARRESDSAVRKDIYWKLQEIVMDDAVIVPLTQKINTIAMNKGTEGVVLYNTDNHDFTNMVIVE